jgi:WD40-like Beta Propeller Repeat
MFRRVLIAAVVLLSLVAATSHAASSTSVSPCRQVSVAVWSPDGQQIAFYGRRWPPPATHHRNPNDILQAFCVAGADGANAQPLRYTVCWSKCPDVPYQLEWLAPNELLALRDGDVLLFAPGSKPKRIARIPDFSFVTNPAGTRLASGTPDCPQCAGPLTILSLPSGAVVGHVGGKKVDNVSPSLSPDGTRVVFGRHPTGDSGATLGIWTANTDGSRLRRLTKVGEHPLWSPTGGKVASVAVAGKTVALRLVSAGGGKSRTLVPGRVQTVFGWSPDGRYIAFETGSGTFGKLAVVKATTGKARRLYQLNYAPTAVWSPDSSELLAYSLAKSQKCWSLSRVPVDGSAPTLISSCNK